MVILIPKSLLCYQAQIFRICSLQLYHCNNIIPTYHSSICFLTICLVLFFPHKIISFFRSLHITQNSHKQIIQKPILVFFLLHQTYFILHLCIMKTTHINPISLIHKLFILCLQILIQYRILKHSHCYSFSFTPKDNQKLKLHIKF